MTPVWFIAPRGQAHSRNTEDVSISPLGEWQFELLIAITQLPPAALYTLYINQTFPTAIDLLCPSANVLMSL